MLFKKSFAQKRNYVKSIKSFESIRDKIVNSNYKNPETSFLGDLVEMESHLISASRTGLSTRKHYKEFQKVKRSLMKSGLTISDSIIASNHAEHLAMLRSCLNKTQEYGGPI
jgi:hypothetical protein